MVKIQAKGNFDKTIKFLHFFYNREFMKNLKDYAEEGVTALSHATPVDTGTTAASWYYEIETRPNSIRINWNNSNLDSNRTPIAILIQYGHSHNGHMVLGRDYINPAIQPVFDDIAEKVWKEVTNA